MIWFISIGMVLWLLGAFGDMEKRTAERRAADPNWRKLP